MSENIYAGTSEIMLLIISRLMGLQHALKEPHGEYLSFGGLEEQFASAFFDVLGLSDLAAGGVFQFDNLADARARV